MASGRQLFHLLKERMIHTQKRRKIEISTRLGIAPKSVVAAFRKLVEDQGSLVKVLQKLISRQCARTTRYCFKELIEGSVEEWSLEIPESEDASAVAAALNDLDVYVMKNRLKDRSSGLEDLLFGETDPSKLSAVENVYSAPLVAEQIDLNQSETEHQFDFGDIDDGTINESCNDGTKDWPEKDSGVIDACDAGTENDTGNVITGIIETEIYSDSMNADDVSSNQNIVVLVDTDPGKQSEKCLLCDDFFPSRHALNCHIRGMHPGERLLHDEECNSIKCPLCDEFIDSKSALQEHCRRVHLRHLTFTSNGDFKLSDNELSKCPKCEYVALKKGRMATHLKDLHGIVVEFDCSVCDKAFSSHRAMYHHFQQFHTMLNSTCDICSKVCKNRSAFQSHYLTHSRSFKCRFCDKVFNDRRCYTQHEKQHSSKQAYLCPYCGRHFNLKANLDRHIKTTHLKEGKLTCKSCTFSTFYKTSLTEHIQSVHFGKKKFLCEHCDKSFSRRLIYDEHMDKHNGIFRYSCESCGKKYRNKARCKQHYMQCSVLEKTLHRTTKKSLKASSSSRYVEHDTAETPFHNPDNLGLIVTMELVENGGISLE